MGIGLNLLGYRGLFHTGLAIVTTLKNTNFFRKIGLRHNSPFKDAYHKAEPFTFYQEVGS
jgi:hypothetical protein